jgi:excisionase family DNA binding protein
MNTSTASESAMTAEEAVEYIREKHSLDYHVEVFRRKARAGEIPSHKVGRYRRFRPSLLDQWALGEWPPDTTPLNGEDGP